MATNYSPAGYVIGVDLGKKRDYTAIAVLKRIPVNSGWTSVQMTGYDENAHEYVYTEEPVPDCRYEVIHLDRWKDKKYKELVPVVESIVRELHQKGHREWYSQTHVAAPLDWSPSIWLVVDQTGVGIPVVDDLRSAGLGCIGISIHGGEAVNGKGDEFRVPKRDLVSTLQVLLQNGRLGIGTQLPLAQVLSAEMENFRAKITLSTGHDTYGAGDDWREGNHDDLVLATAIGAWYGETQAHSIPAGTDGGYWHGPEEGLATPFFGPQ